MTCPKCGSEETDVTDTRKRDKFGVLYPYVYRRRICPECKYKYTTYEISSDDFMRMRNSEKTFEKIRRLIVSEPADAN